MRSMIIFILRLIMSVILAFVIGRFFFTTFTPLKVSALALVMLALAYLFEHTRKRDGG